jgi:integrase/recombinase XerD
MTETRRRYETAVRAAAELRATDQRGAGPEGVDVRLVDGTARSVRVIGKGDKERLVPLPEAFGAVFGFWLKDQPRGEYVFAKAAAKSRCPRKRPAPTCGGCCKKAGIDKKISPHKLRHTYATNLLNAGAELVDIKALLGHESIATTQIYTNVGQERMEKVVGRL